MKKALACVVVLLVLAGAAWVPDRPAEQQVPQQPAVQEPAAVPDGWTAFGDPEKPRSNGLRKNATAGRGEPLICTWTNPATPGDTIALTVQSPRGAETSEFVLEGIDMAVLRVNFSRIIDGVQSTRRTYSLCYLPTGGSYSIFPPDCLDKGFGFQVTPNKPLPGLFDVQVKWNAKSVVPAASRDR